MKYKSGIYNMMKQIFYTATLILISLCAHTYGQMRGVWICSGDLRTSEAVLSCLDKCAALGLSDVFLQVRTAGDAAYKSATEPPPRKSLADDLDVLELACTHGHKLGLRVHAWLNINYCAPGPGLPAASNHIANRHPEWVACGRDGTSMALLKKPELRKLDSEGLYLSPDAEGICDYFYELICEILVRYPVDGIHLDFIRYANYRFDYGGKLAQAFIDKYHIEPGIVAYEKGQCSNDHDCEGLELWRRIMNLRWIHMRADALTELVQAIRHAQVATRPDAVLSAAVWFPQPWAYSYVGQDWMHWLDEDIIDLAIPMAYSKGDEPLKSYLPNVKEYLESGRMVAGLGAWRLDGAGIIHKMELTGQNGGGWVLFDYGSLMGREKVVEDMGKYIDERYSCGKSNLNIVPRGWQMGWANRRPLVSLERYAMLDPIANDSLTSEDDNYRNEAAMLSMLAGKTWGDRRLLPPVNVLSARVLPWVDKCNQNIALLPKPQENDLRDYFAKHQSRYLPIAKKKRRRQKRTKEEIEVAYQKNRDMVYRDVMLDRIGRIVDDIIKQRSVSALHELDKNQSDMYN